ncbi:MAG: lysylphosphatidylglycerol synthase transmembrane domain-containing protein [Gaiellaceae bacterium]
MRQSRLLHAGLVAVAAAGVAGLLVFHGPNWGQVGHALAAMRWSWALAAVGLNLVSAIVRGLAWRTVLTEAIPPPHARLLDVLSAFFVGIFANGILPGRAGEIARVGVLARHLPRREGTWPALIGTVVAHRLLEILPSLALIVWVLLFAKVPAWGHDALIGVFAGALVVLVVGLFVARRHEAGQPAAAGRVATVLVRAREGLGILRSPQAATVAAALQTAAWALQLAAVWTAMRAFHLSLPITAAAAVLALMNVALILPLWPGNVGLQQAAIALPLIAYGVAYAHGFAYGIGLQAIESSVGYVLGVAFLFREGLTIGLLRVRPQPIPDRPRVAPVPRHAEPNQADRQVARDR